MARSPAPDRPSLPSSGPERATLEAFLDFYRATLLTKCDGLDDAALRQRPVATSALSLLGLVRHCTFVEQVWFQVVFSALEVEEYYKLPEDRDADFNDLNSATVEEVFANYDRAVARSRELAAGHDFDEMARAARRGREVDLRWIYVHLIEEYARHLGHADLLREMIDGETGY